MRRDLEGRGFREGEEDLRRRDLERGRGLFFDGEAEVADYFAEGEVLAVGVG